MKKVKYLSIIIIILLMVYGYNNFFLKSMIIGEYINKNYNPSIAEIPYEQDTLILFDNNRFASKFWGNGTYKVLSTIAGTKLELTYTYEFGKGIFVGSLNRLFFGKPKLILNRDRNHYFEKNDK